MNSVFKNNENLAKALQKGNKKAFAFLFDTYYKNLCKYIFGFTKNQKQSEDIVQNAMLSLWNARGTINPQKSVKSYLYKIAYHQFINEYRENKERLNYFGEVKKMALESHLDETDEDLKNRQTLILSEIQKLPPKCREVFLLSKLHGLKYKEIAEELDISIKTVEIHMSKAIRKIREKLKGQSLL